MLYNETVEQAFLGALLAQDTVFDDVSFLHGSHFYTPVHGRIFDHIKKLKFEGKSVTPAFIQQFFVNDNDLPSSRYIHELVEYCVTTTGAKAHAAQIYSMFMRRQLKELASDLNKLADNPDIDQSPKDLLAQAENFITNAAEVENTESLYHIGHNLEQAIKNAGRINWGIRGGIPSLDEITKGYHAGRLYVIAARPAMGKTALGLTLAENMASKGSKTLFFSLEMTLSELQGRLIQRYRHDAANLANSHLYVDDKSGLTVNDITQRARRHKRRHGLDAIFIDYLGLIQASDTRAQMVHQIGEITRRLKQLAKDLKIPVVLLCQLNRGVEGKDDKRPDMSHLRDSGAIEQDADCVMFIYREEYYLANVKADSRFKGKEDIDHMAALQNAKGKAEIIVRKNRQGKLGTAYVNFDAEGQVFFD